MVFGWNPIDKYYDGKVVVSDRNMNKINKVIETEKKELMVFNASLISYMNKISVDYTFDAFIECGNLYPNCFVTILKIQII